MLSARADDVVAATPRVSAKTKVAVIELRAVLIGVSFVERERWQHYRCLQSCNVPQSEADLLTIITKP